MLTVTLIRDHKVKMAVRASLLANASLAVIQCEDVQ